jgi:hypothetical protein
MQRLHSVPGAAYAQAQATSTGTADEKTITPPGAATASGPSSVPVACLITVETNAALMAFNNQAVSGANRQVVPSGAAPLYLPFAGPIRFTSAAAAACVVNVTWLW